MRIGEVLNGVFDDDVGWRPATGAIKPVHVANGLFRAVFGHYFSIDSIIELVAWERYGRPITERSFDQLLVRRPDVYAAYRDRESSFDQMRRYMRGVLAADGAVFPSADNSALTLSTARMVSRDPMDRGVGDFASALIGDVCDR